MAKSQQTFNKSEKEKKRRKKKKEKAERREQRKLEKSEQGKLSFEEQIRYLDEDGNLTATPPDPNKKKKVIKAEDIVLGVPSREKVDFDPVRHGRVNFFNTEKGFGFITDAETRESVFVHINNTEEPIGENDKVSYEVEMGPKGANAVRVRIQKDKPKPVIKPVIKEEVEQVDKPDKPDEPA